MAIRKSVLRQVINEEIRRIVNEGVDDPGILKMVFLAGGPGSGKSYVADELFGIPHNMKLQKFSAGGLKVVNSDNEFEKKLRDNGIDPKDLARIEKEDPVLWAYIQGENPESLRNQAKAQSKKFKGFYTKGRLGMIIDGTGKSYEKISKQKKQAEEFGYDTYMVFVNTSLEVARERNQNRSRTVPEDVLVDSWNEVQNNLGAFQRLFGNTSFTIVDNNEHKPIDNAIQKAINEFMRRPIRNPIGKKWVEDARKLKRAKAI